MGQTWVLPRPAGLLAGGFGDFETVLQVQIGIGVRFFLDLSARGRPMSGILGRGFEDFESFLQIHFRISVCYLLSSLEGKRRSWPQVVGSMGSMGVWC